MQAYWFVRIDMPFLSIINQTIYNMDKNKIHGFMDQVYQCIKYRLNCCKCDCCIFGHDNLWAKSYVACRLCDPKGFFKLIK